MIAVIQQASPGHIVRVDLVHGMPISYQRAVLIRPGKNGAFKVVHLLKTRLLQLLSRFSRAMPY